MIYQQTPPLDRLEQGDVLKKTPELAALVAEYHPYYAQKQENKFFVVLTQSCDLVRRGGSCKARYISMAPARPLKVVLKREFAGKLENVGQGAMPFATQRVRTSLEQFLERLFHNDEPPFFYYEAAHESGIYEEMCALLALPISLKPEHYEALRAAKLAGITDVFQAKLGWLLGQMYSRVGTPDFEREVVSAKVKSYLEGVALWLDHDDDAKALCGLIANTAVQRGAGPVSAKELATLITKIPKRKSLVIDAILNAAQSEGLIAPRSTQRLAFRRALEKDDTLLRYL